MDIYNFVGNALGITARGRLPISAGRFIAMGNYMSNFIYKYIVSANPVFHISGNVLITQPFPPHCEEIHEEKLEGLEKARAAALEMA